MSINKFKEKIEEYIVLLKECGYITNEQILNEIYIKLNSLDVERIYNAPGDAVVIGNKLKICLENIEENVKKKGEYYIDEVLFHEFSHVINSFHNAIYGDNRFIVSDYIQKKMKFPTTINLLEQDDALLYNQDPSFGIILLDEFIAQSISQKMVIEKSKKLDDKSKKKYMCSVNLLEYEDRFYITKICKPPMIIKTSLANYPEFDVFAQKFIHKYGYGIKNFIKNSLQKNFTENFINSFSEENINKLYIDLCYLGIIQQRIYFLNGFTTIDDIEDPAYDSRKVFFAMRKILKK